MHITVTDGHFQLIGEREKVHTKNVDIHKIKEIDKNRNMNKKKNVKLKT